MIKLGKVVKIINVKNKDKFYLRKVGNSSKIFEDHLGNVIRTTDILDKEYGLFINGYLITKPSIDDFILYYWKRKTQIVYPKDASYIISKMGINYKSNVLEIATGSGAMTLFLARSLYPSGKVISIEKNFDFLKNAVQNIIDFDLTYDTDYRSVIDFLASDHLIFLRKNRFDAVFLDIPFPERMIEHLNELKISTSFLICVVPTVNQVASFIRAIQEDYIDIDVEEIILRKYKPNPDRLRPVDTMVAHTCYVISAKKI